MKSGCKPRIALVLGDPAGIGPELVAKLLAEPTTAHAADLLVIAGRRAFEEGMRIAGCQSRYTEIARLEHADFSAGLPLLHDPGGLADNDAWHGRVGVDSGRYCLQTLSVALELTRRGVTDALVFGPLNKHALHMAGMQSSDELHWFAQRLAHDGPVCEFNVLDDLWTSRVTSHIALKEVPAMITREGVLKAIGLIHDTLGHLEKPMRVWHDVGTSNLT